MSPRRAGQPPLWRVLVVLASFFIMAVVGPVVAIVLSSWVPLLFGFLAWLAAFLVVITLAVIEEYRRPPTAIEQAVHTLVNGLNKVKEPEASETGLTKDSQW